MMKFIITRKLFSLLTVLLISFALSYNALSAKNDYFKTGKTESLDSEGIKFRGLKDFVFSPSPIPEYKFYYKNEQSAEKIEFFDLNDLWRSEQYLGIWKGEEGILTIAKIKLPAPEIKNLKDGCLPKTIFTKWLDENNAQTPNDKDSIKKWLQVFFSLSSLGEEQILPNNKSPKNCQASVFKSQKNSSNTPVYVYILEPKLFPELKIAVCYEFSKAINIDIEKSEKTIDSSIASFEFFKKNQKQEIKPVAHAKKIDRSPEYLESREQVIKNIKNAKGWDFSETDNFILVYNVKSDKTIKDVSDNLERCRAVFEAFYPLKTPLKAVSVCRFFENRNDYINYVGKEYEWTGGLWHPARKELVVSPVDWMSNSNSRKTMVSVAYHEGFHQYLHYAVNEATSSIWFNEGNATFFEGIVFKGNKFEIELTDRLRQMKKLAGRDVNIKSIINMEHKEFISGNVEDNYTLVWGLMFFLHKGAPVMKEKNNYSEIPNKYYEFLVESANAKKANEETWKDIDLEKFERDFKTFWNENSLIRKAEKFYPLASKTKSQQPKKGN